MTARGVLVDSSILIDHLRGRPDATRFLTAIQAGPGLLTSVVVAAELLLGARNANEQRAIDGFLAQFRLEPIDVTDGPVALSLLRQHRLSGGVGWLDCLIAAAAIHLAVPVATLNAKHFAPIGGLATHRPY